MKSEDYEKKIIEKLNKMPRVTDQMNKDELYKRISTKMQVNKARQNKRKVIIPIFGTALVLVMMLIMLPSFINNNVSQTSEVRSTNDSDKKMDKMDEANQEESTLNNNHIESYVVQTVDENSTIIYGAVADNQLQYIVPLSIIVPKATDLNHDYNNIEDYLKESEWGINDYIFNDVVFDIDQSNNQVIMDLPIDFSIGEGSASTYIFSELLEAMFNPYQIKKVDFKSEHDIDLGSFGAITELPLKGEDKVNYKIFQADENKRKFLIPIKQDNGITIEEAFDDMKKNEDSYNVYQTIPDDITYSLTVGTDELIVLLENGNEFTNQQESLTMIEAMLMTAKSFGYESVQFENIANTQVGPYDLSKSIHVPEAVNPIE